MCRPSLNHNKHLGSNCCISHCKHSIRGINYVWSFTNGLWLICEFLNFLFNNRHNFLIFKLFIFFYLALLNFLNVYLIIFAFYHPNFLFQNFVLLTFCEKSLILRIILFVFIDSFCIWLRNDFLKPGIFYILRRFMLTFNNIYFFYCYLSEDILLWSSILNWTQALNLLFPLHYRQRQNNVCLDLIVMTFLKSDKKPELFVVKNIL